MFWPRVFRVGSRLAIAIVASAIVLVVSVRCYVEYEVHRAKAMLTEASRVQVGDAEATVLPLVNQYGGFKWTPDQLGRKEDWIDKDEYEYQKNLVSEYRYALAVSPFGLIPSDLHWSQNRIYETFRAVMSSTSVPVRGVLSMRDWGAEVDVAIRGGRVQLVSGMVVVEGRSRWMGHRWQFADAMPEHRLHAKDFVVMSSHLEMATNNGDMTENYFTQRASDEEMQMSRKFNSACLTNLRGCYGFCDFVPRTLEYLKRHPDTAVNFISPTCP